MQVGVGTRAVVTGASKGIGRAIATALAERGARVGLVARSKGELEALAAALPGDHVVLAADVTDYKELKRALDEFVDEAGGLDLLVANAGLAHYRSFPEQPVGEIDQMVDVNVTGSLYTVHAALPSMIEAGSGHIVVIASGAALRSFPSAAVYGATKAANQHFAEALRHDLADTGIDVTVVFPGEIESDLHTHELERLPAWRNNDEQLPAAELAAAVIDGVEAGARRVHFPKLVRVLGLNGIAPGVVDTILRRLRGNSAAPRR